MNQKVLFWKFACVHVYHSNKECNHRPPTIYRGSCFSAHSKISHTMKASKLRQSQGPGVWFFHKSEIESRFINLLGNLGQVLSKFWKIQVFNEKSMQIMFLTFSSFGHYKNANLEIKFKGLIIKQKTY